MEGNVVPPLLPIFSTPPLPPKTRFLVLDLYGYLVQCVCSPRVTTVSFCKSEDAKYNGPPHTSRASFCTSGRDFGASCKLPNRNGGWLCEAPWSPRTPKQSWSSSSRGLESPCLILGHVSCKTLHTLDGKVVKKPNNLAVNQYLKVLKLIFCDQRPSMVGRPYDVRPTRDNMLMMDDNAFKTFRTRHPTS